MAFRDSNHQVDAAANLEFVIETLQVRVDGVGRNRQVPCDARLVLVVEDGLDNLKLALGEREPLGDLQPDVVVEETTSGLALPIFSVHRHLTCPRGKSAGHT